MQEEENYATTKVILLKVDNLDNLLSYHYNYYQLSEPFVNIMIDLSNFNLEISIGDSYLNIARFVLCLAWQW
jgi:hypothetical protein